MAGSVTIIDDVFGLVRDDGIPREARGMDTDGQESRHMVYRDSRGAIRSCLMENWPQEKDDIEDKISSRAAQRSNLSARVNLLTGKRIGELRSQEAMDMMEAVFRQLKALDDEGKIRPYDEWGRTA